jgi:hypothetical protein
MSSQSLSQANFKGPLLEQDSTEPEEIVGELSEQSLDQVTGGYYNLQNARANGLYYDGAYHIAPGSIMDPSAGKKR